MENEIYENNGTPQYETYTNPAPQYETYANPAPVAEKQSFVDTAKNVAANVVVKSKALWADRANLLTKIKAVPKKIWMMIGGGVAALIALIVVVSLLGNNYKTPIKLMQAQQNNKKASAMIAKETATYNGFCEKEYRQIANIMKKSDYYDEEVAAFEETVESKSERYGDNYKYKYKVVDKEKIDKDDLKEVQKELRAEGRSIYNEYKNLDSDDYEEMADGLGLTKAQAKKIGKLYKSIGKTMKKASVTKGYKLTVERTITGSELDKPKIEEITYTVYKINGRWVML